jgi:hypothetical protein
MTETEGQSAPYDSADHLVEVEAAAGRCWPLQDTRKWPARWADGP